MMELITLTPIMKLSRKPRYADYRRFRELRLQKGLTTHAVADFLGVSDRTINFWESGTLGMKRIYFEKFLQVIDRDWIDVNDLPVPSNVAVFLAWTDSRKFTQHAVKLKGQQWINAETGKPEIHPIPTHWRPAAFRPTF